MKTTCFRSALVVVQEPSYLPKRLTCLGESSSLHSTLVTLKALDDQQDLDCHHLLRFGPFRYELPRGHCAHPAPVVPLWGRPRHMNPCCFYRRIFHGYSASGLVPEVEEQWLQENQRKIAISIVRLEDQQANDTCTPPRQKGNSKESREHPDRTQGAEAIC